MARVLGLILVFCSLASFGAEPDQQALDLFHEAYRKTSEAKYLEADQFFVKCAQMLSANPETALSGECIFSQAWHLQNGLANENVDRSPAVELYQRAADAFKRAGNARLQGIALQNLAQSLLPTVNPNGNISKAILLVIEAARLEREAGDKRELLDCLSLLGRFHLTAFNPDGNRTIAAEYYSLAQELALKLGEEANQSGDEFLYADCLRIQAAALRTDNNINGNDQMSAINFAKSARIFKQLDFGYLSADTLLGQAFALVRDVKVKESEAVFNQCAQQYEALIKEAERAGDKLSLGDYLFFQAECLRTDINASGDAARAAVTAQKAVRAYAAAGRKYEQIDALADLAECLKLTSADDKWAQVLAQFEASEKVAQTLGHKGLLGRSLARRASALRPDVNPAGDWNKAAQLFERAAHLAVESGNKSDEGEALFGQAECMEEDKNSKGNWNTAAELFGNAAKAYGALNDFALFRANCLYNQGLCLMEDKNKSGSWSKAEMLFTEAAQAYASGGDKSSQALSYHQQGYCLVKGRTENMTPEARALFKEAAKILRREGKQKEAENAESWLK